MSDFSTDVDLSEFGLDANEVFASSDTTDFTADDVDVSTDVENPVTPDTLETESDSSFDWEQYSDKPVRVKVQGEEVEVPLRELRDGYMRQSDYTRKTQEIAELRAQAEWAQQVRAAFENDPVGTLRAFEEAFGQPQEPASNPFEGIDDPELHPLINELQSTKAQLAEMRQWQARQEALAAQAAEQRMVEDARRELDQAKSKYPDLDVTETLQLAASKGLPIEDAYLLLRGRNAASGADEAAKAQAKAAEQAKIVAAKQQASQAVSSVRGGRGVEQTPEHDSFEDLLETFMKTT